MVTLATDRLLLREFRQSDLDSWSLLGYGRVGCWNPEGWPDLEIAWTLHRSFWGRGYATEAARAALHYAFTELGQPHVVSLIHPDNSRSIRVAERLGERLFGSAELTGKPVLVYRITRGEREALNGAVPAATLPERNPPAI